MLHLILNFLTQLSMLYLLTAMFVLLDLLLLSIRRQRLGSERLARERNKANDQAARHAQQEQERAAFEQRQARLAPAAG